MLFDLLVATSNQWVLRTYSMTLSSLSLGTIHTELCERIGKELPLNLTIFTKVTLCMYVYI